MRDVVIMLATVLFFALPPVAVAVWPREGAAVVVVATPDAAAVVRAADGSLLTLSDRHDTAVTRASGSDAGYLARLRAAGARLIVAAPGDLACLATASSASVTFTSRDTR